MGREGRPRYKVFTVGCWGPALRKCSYMFVSAVETCFQRAGVIVHATNTSGALILCVPDTVLTQGLGDT